MGQDDWLLMHRVADGDEGAVAELYDRFGSLVYKVARQTADRYDPRRAKLVTWVMLIARRHLIDRLRRNAVRGTPGTFQPDAPDTQGDHRPERRPQEDERNVSLMQRVAELPELQRVVIERAYLQGYTLREVSEQLEAPLGTVKSALSRGLARLRERAKADWAV
ncbi:MAG: RNA polymerase sigma factor [Planctomycetota bacterium]|jgi:RNA polymerase sigma-70 factor (ECF subfamily)